MNCRNSRPKYSFEKQKIKNYSTVNNQANVENGYIRPAWRGSKKWQFQPLINYKHSYCYLAMAVLFFTGKILEEGLLTNWVNHLHSAPTNSKPRALHDLFIKQTQAEKMDLTMHLCWLSGFYSWGNRGKYFFC